MEEYRVRLEGRTCIQAHPLLLLLLLLCACFAAVVGWDVHPA
jgi:hypothetical protein